MKRSLAACAALALSKKIHDEAMLSALTSCCPAPRSRYYPRLPFLPMAVSRAPEPNPGYRAPTVTVRVPASSVKTWAVKWPSVSRRHATIAP